MPPKQRIAFVANTSWSIYKFRLHVLLALVKKGFAVYVLAPRDKYTGLFEHTPGISFIELKKLKSKSISPADDLQLYRELLHHYRQLRPSLIFHYTIKANIYGSMAAARIRCPAVCVITGLGYMFTGRRLLTFAVSQLYRHALRNAKEVWFLNHDDQHVFINNGLVPAHKTFILPGEGVDPSVFYAAPYRPTTAPTSFLLIARLIEHKGIHEFVQAARLLRTKNRQVLCSLLGFFDDKSAVAISSAQMLQWQKDENIVYLGETDQVVPYIEKADCIVLPSYREGMPLSLLEGASMCKALVAADTPGCREIVQHGHNGFLCKPRDAADLAAKMEAYDDLPASAKTAMGLAGREIVLQHFTNEKITAIYLNKLESLQK